MSLGTEVKEVKEVNEVKERRIGPVKTYGDLLVYRQAYSLALAVSEFTKAFPREERFELGKQLRRCARSVPANIVEGWTKRNSPAEFKRHLVIAAGEIAESRFWIELAVDEKIAKQTSAEELTRAYSRLGFMVHNLWKEWRKL